MRIITLGTSGMAPTRNRALPSIVLDYYGDILLFDAGEGCQSQLLKAGIRRNRVSYIFITHWHADHTSGLPGLLHTINSSNINKTIHIFGPKGTKKHIKNLLNAFKFQTNSLKLKVKELNPKRVVTVIKTKRWKVLAAPMKHSVPINAYSFLELPSWRIQEQFLKDLNLEKGPWLNKIKEGKAVKVDGKEIKPEMVAKLIEGRKATIIMDTRPNEFAIKLSKDSDILFIESMFISRDIEKAKNSKHLTAKEAATIAREANVKKLVLLHFSQRYRVLTQILREAKAVFPNTCLSKDLMEFRVKKK